MIKSTLFAAASLVAATVAPAHATLKWNGPMLQGTSLNGISLQGISLNGLKWNGFRMNGLTLNGLTLNGPEFNGPQFNGTGASASPNANTDAFGAGGRVLAIEF